jgi:hypothetical protein
MAFRESLSTHGHNTNNFVERGFLAIKDTVLQRCKAESKKELAGFAVKDISDFSATKILQVANWPARTVKQLCEVTTNCQSMIIEQNCLHCPCNSEL